MNGFKGFAPAEDALPARFRDTVRVAYLDPDDGNYVEIEQDTDEREESSGPLGSVCARTGQPENQDHAGGGWLPEFLAHEFPELGWLIEPMIPRTGVVFLHGPTSAGKSPWTWALAAAVCEGTPFCGYPITAVGPVLYIELDTPASLIQPRLRRLKTVPDLMWLEVFKQPIDICNPDRGVRGRLDELQKRVQPMLVVVNTLRKAHLEDDKDSGTPSRVYGAWRGFFPEAVLLFVHHDKKTNTDGKKQSTGLVDQDQMFSGSQAWANDAQVAFHLMRARAPKQDGGASEAEYAKTPITVRMTKSQVSDHERFPPLQMRLEPDGTNWVDMGPAAYRTFYATLHPARSKGSRIQDVMTEFDIGRSAAYAACEGMK